MIARLSMLLVLTTLTSGFVGCATSPQARSGSSRSAAFVAFDEPWQKDLVTSVPPAYSLADRAAWRQGRGLFHLTLDSKSGAVLQVTVKKSTGHRTLDESAVTALRQWRFRPGTWTSLDIPVAFVMAKSETNYSEWVRRSQKQGRRL
jgi:TonB family protein